MKNGIGLFFIQSSVEQLHGIPHGAQMVDMMKCKSALKLE